MPKPLLSEADWPADPRRPRKSRAGKAGPGASPSASAHASTNRRTWNGYAGRRSHEPAGGCNQDTPLKGAAADASVASALSGITAMAPPHRTRCPEQPRL